MYRVILYHGKRITIYDVTRVITIGFCRGQTLFPRVVVGNIELQPQVLR